MVTRYSLSLRFLHWLLALLLIIGLGVGLVMTDMPLSPFKLKVYSWHKWLGVSIFFLVLIRLCVRIRQSVPELPRSMSASEQALAGIGHALLYGLMVCIPLSGWLMSSAMGFQTVWFGVIPLPDLIPKNEELGDQLVVLHSWLNWGLIFMIVAHVGAALKHQFIDKENFLRRML
ncbi:MAG TPA: cytochrome b [Candidatus Paenalcaligenes intestinipullorum]|uniref:Cytochrome b n=1 Tax=Candidatus Paenalcaligenes intestinipullorum TaxID=2838718 RepID=A0A9D2RHG8_9BURK|nr:cytochrome b [Candidatus Paenalcaligenes intestinipullorum]